MDPVALLPPIHFQTSFRHQSSLKSPRSSRTTRRPRHCTDADCPIWSPFATQVDRWAAFDAFDPCDVDHYGYDDTVATTPDSRRSKRAEELRTRAKARLMPPYDPCQPRPTRRSGGGGRDRNNGDRSAYRTPSPAPQPAPIRHSPRTPIRARRLFDDSDDELTPHMTTTFQTPAHTPASTVASWSPVPTPRRLPLRFQSPSP